MVNRAETQNANDSQRNQLGSCKHDTAKAEYLTCLPLDSGKLAGHNKAKDGEQRYSAESQFKERRARNSLVECEQQPLSP